MYTIEVELCNIALLYNCTLVICQSGNMTISDVQELLSTEHRRFCVEELQKLPSLRKSNKKDDQKYSNNKNKKDAAVLVPLCQLSDGSVGLLYTKRSLLLRYDNASLTNLGF